MRFAALGFATLVAAAFALVPGTASAGSGTATEPAHATDVQPVYYCTRRDWRHGLCGAPGTQCARLSPRLIRIAAPGSLRPSSGFIAGSMVRGCARLS